MGKRKLLLFALVASAILTAMSLRAEAQTVSLDAVLKACGSKVTVMGWTGGKDRALVKVGESLSDYCQGILEGMLAVLVHARTICLKDKRTSPDFLLSIVLTYREETKSQDNDLANVVEAAFKRAFSCSN